VRSFCILHVDDDPLMRDVVELSLGLDPTFTLISCASADEALAMAAERAPDLMLCDVLMPDMDGPAMLVRLRENARTAKIPVVFMTARTQPCEIERLKSLGAAAVIAKPFDPAQLAATVRGHLHSAKLATAGYDFVERLRTDAAMLATFRKTLWDDPDKSVVPAGLQTCVHKLAGAAGVFNFQTVSSSASALEESIIERRAGRGTPEKVEANFDALLECIERE
jgi:two-component system OmpR family response regulator